VRPLQSSHTPKIPLLSSVRLDYQEPIINVAIEKKLPLAGNDCCNEKRSNQKIIWDLERKSYHPAIAFIFPEKNVAKEPH